MLKIYNSFTGKKEEFKPIHSDKIGIYVCGNTVYDFCHLGHARSMIMFDTIVRYLRYRYPDRDMIYVRNVTDIDDNIIARAAEKDLSPFVLANYYLTFQRTDENALGLLKPNAEPRVSLNIPIIINYIEHLINEEYAYIAENGDVLFNLNKVPNYGKFGHRGEKKDFALWKPDENGYKSPWGNGYPGWHTECAAMSVDLLGQPFDIHGGGMDLKFPHHENEIAQAEIDGNPLANYWMHTGLLTINGEKMGKSNGNSVTIREALLKYHPEELRMFMLNSKYSQPADYCESSMIEAQQRLKRLYQAIDRVPTVELAGYNSKILNKFCNIMDDDFNTHEALILLNELAMEIHSLRNANSEVIILSNTLKKIGNILGLLNDEKYLKRIISEEIQVLINLRNQFRLQKNWKAADEIREKLKIKGITVEDDKI